MQGYPVTHDPTGAGSACADIARCLRDGAAISPSRYLELLVLANVHAVAPLLREQVLACARGGDPELSALRDEALREAALETRRNARLAHAIDALAAAGVPSLIFKGTALAHRHYRRPDLRPRDDTDLLIRMRHRDAAHTVLTRSGFSHVPGIEGSLIMSQRLYRSVDGDGLLHNLDVHWAVTNEPRAATFSSGALLAASEPLPALSPHARAPDDVTSMLLACLHLDAHHAHDVRLVWLYDVDRLARALDRVQREKLHTLARRHRLVDPCAWVLVAAHEALGTPLEGFAPLLASWDGRRPAAGRAARWLRDLSRLPGAAERARWLGQHFFPGNDYLRLGAAAHAPLWRLYVNRALRGVGHLCRR